jgi:hypothetical protein
MEIRFYNALRLPSHTMWSKISLKLNPFSHDLYSPHHLMATEEVGKVTLKSNGDGELSDEFLLKRNCYEALNDEFP